MYFAKPEITIGSLTEGELIAIINYISQILLAIIVFSNLITMYTRAYISAKRVKSVLDLEVYKDEGKIDEFTNNNIDIKNISFSYNENQLLKDFNLQINEGEILGIIGQAGSGKSTILKLINKSYDIQCGEILIGGRNINEYKSSKIKENVVLISQKPDFFRMSIKENIVLGRKNILDEDVIMALKKSQGWEFVQRLPDGIETILDNDANNFSGGQKKRIAIARSFIGNSKILLLDDITSGVDAKTEKEVLKNMYEFIKKNKITTIICSQKLSSFKYADRILVLKNGEIEAVGTKEQLEKDSKTYQEIKKLLNDEEG